MSGIFRGLETILNYQYIQNDNKKFQYTMWGSKIPLQCDDQKSRYNVMIKNPATMWWSKIPIQCDDQKSRYNVMIKNPATMWWSKIPIQCDDQKFRYNVMIKNPDTMWWLAPKSRNYSHLQQACTEGLQLFLRQSWDRKPGESTGQESRCLCLDLGILVVQGSYYFLC